MENKDEKKRELEKRRKELEEKRKKLEDMQEFMEFLLTCYLFPILIFIDPDVFKENKYHVALDASKFLVIGYIVALVIIIFMYILK